MNYDGLIAVKLNSPYIRDLCIILSNVSDVILNINNKLTEKVFNNSSLNGLSNSQ